MIRTYELSHESKTPLYVQLYEAIRADILSGSLPGGEKLPSKRALAEHLHVSVITVESAYSQLEAEGYLQALPKRGFFVAAVEQMAYNSLQEEITAKQIGEMVMSSLRQLDEVAYVRFASVYRQFTDIPTFMRELSHMLDEAGRSGEKNAPADTAGTAEEAAKQEE